MPIYRSHVLICGGTGCASSGSREVTESFRNAIRDRGLSEEVLVVPTGCHGMCEMGPIVVVYPEGTFYSHVSKGDVPEIVEEHIYKGRPVQRLMYSGSEDMPFIPHYKEIPFYGKQHRIALANCGYINPDNIEEYVARGGYEALGKALAGMTPAQVIDEVKTSGLRGRGGGGFPTGLKWSFCASAKGDKKYVICNADEGDPGAFMDRSILEGDPHSVIEGMMLGAYAMGADEGYIYCRAEYPLAIQRLKTAMAQAEAYGLLGENIMDSSFSFTLHVKEGAGAFVCGEETALMASIEGRRGCPGRGLRSLPIPASGGVPRTSTTWRPGPMFPRSSETAGHGTPPWEPRSPRERRSSPSRERSSTPASWKCPWASPSGRSSSTSAAAYWTTKNSRRSRSAAPAEDASPRSIWTPR